jgi:vancomycin resistance protein VanJ
MTSRDSGRRARQFVGPDGRVHAADVASGRVRTTPPPPATPPSAPRRRARTGLPWWRRLDRAVAWWLTPLASRRWHIRSAAWIAWGVCAAFVVLWALLAWQSDRWVLPTVLLYGPRLFLTAPLALIGAIAIVIRARLALPILLAGGILLGPIAGWRSGWRGWFASDAPTVRVMTLNAGGRRLDRSPAELVAATQADLWTVQECTDRTWEQLEGALPSWHRRRDYGLCTLSRWPITAVDTMDRADFERSRERGSMAAAYVVRSRIASPTGPISLINVHLATARWGLSGFLPSELRAGASVSEAGDRFERNAQLRRFESERAANWAVRSPSPIIVAGDFNLPVESALFRREWSGLTDAWEQVGRGFGFTKFEKWIRIRIDHVLTDDALRPVSATVGPDVGSDHRPVIVGYVRR